MQQRFEFMDLIVAVGLCATIVASGVLPHGCKWDANQDRRMGVDSTAHRQSYWDGFAPTGARPSHCGSCPP